MSLKSLGTIVSIVNVILSIFIMTIIITNTKNIFFNTEVIDFIINDWNSSPIYNITLKDKCDESLNEYPLINNGWEGTVNGCDCTNMINMLSFFSDKRIYRRECNKNDTFAGCKNIDSIERKPFSNWKSKKIICAVKLLNTTYSNISNSNKLFKLIQSNENCDKDENNCGLIDTTQNYLCVSKKLPCPLNGIYILKKGKSPPYNSTIIYNSIELDDDYFLYFTNQLYMSGIIYSKLVLSEEKVCSYELDNERNQSYILEVDIRKKCRNWLNNTDFIYDDRYIKLDIINKNKIISDNHIDQLINTLPYYNNDINNINITLYIKQYTGWKSKCEKNHKYNKQIIYSIKNRISFSNIIHKITKILSIINFSLSILAFLVSSNVKYLLQGHNIVTQLCFIISSLIMIILYFWVLITHFSIKSDLKQVISNQCGDEVTNKTLEFISLHIETQYDEIVLLMNLVIILTYPFLFLIKFFFSNKDSNQISGLVVNENVN